MRSITRRAGCVGSVNSVLSFIATLSSLICRLEITAFTASGNSGSARMASKIRASVSMARLSVDVFGMPSSAERMIFGALGVALSENSAGIIGSLAGVLPGMTGGPKRPIRSSASRRNISCSRADWLSRLAAAPLPASAATPADWAGRLASSACCRACKALFDSWRAARGPSPGYPAR
jgi:hypothetical protein